MEMVYQEPEMRVFQKVIILTVFLTSGAVCIAATSDAAPFVIYDDSRMAAFCLAGSIAGSLLTISMTRKDEGAESTKVKKLCFKLGSQILCGVVFGPTVVNAVADYLHKPIITSDFVVAVSGFVSIFGLKLINKLMDFVENNEFIEKYFGKFFNK